MKNMIIHGEVNFFEVSEIPKLAKKIELGNDYYVVGESETHGNDHRVMVNEFVTFFMIGGIVFMKNEKPTKVYCPNKVRHDETEIMSGTWEIGKAQEYDYELMEKRNVED